MLPSLHFALSLSRQRNEIVCENERVMLLTYHHQRSQRTDATVLTRFFALIHAGSLDFSSDSLDFAYSLALSDLIWCLSITLIRLARNMVGSLDFVYSLTDKINDVVITLHQSRHLILISFFRALSNSL